MWLGLNSFYFSLDQKIIFIKITSRQTHKNIKQNSQLPREKKMGKK